MIIAEWKGNLYKGVDANKVANEISTLGNNVDPKDVVNLARDESNELHKCFEWDDSIAAEKYRVEQARRVMCFLVIREEKAEPEKTPIRFFYKTKEEEGYKPTTFIMKHEDEYQALLTRAKGELKTFEQKYKMLTELKSVFEAIDAL